VLRLEPLDPIAVQPSAAERGTILHDIIGGFVEAHPKELPHDSEAELLQRGADRFSGIADAYPELYALWWPAFVRFVPAYLEWERERRAGLSAIHVERSGSITVPIRDGRRLHAARPGGPHRVRPWRAGDHHRFQERQRALEQGGGDRVLAAAHARGRDADGGRASTAPPRPRRCPNSNTSRSAGAS
jgi:hypothetical protein